MAAVQLAAAGTGNGTTAGVAVTEARNYSFHVSWNGVGTGPTLTIQCSVDGTNYFTPLLGSNVSQTGTEIVYRIESLPVTKMRLIVAGLSTGTISAYVSAV